MQHGRRLALAFCIMAEVLSCRTVDPVADAAGQDLHDLKLAEFSETLEQVKGTQVALGARWEAAPDEEAREVVRDEARRFVTTTIVGDIFPAWMGTPWTMYAVKDGITPDALVPGTEGKGTSCSYFVATVLVNAGLNIDRKKFAGAIATYIQRSLAPAKEDLHRLFGISPEKLEKKVVSYGDGLYLAGLNCHIGFVVVDGGEARFVHASYVDPWEVVDEKLSMAETIRLSEKSGYVITTLFRDDRLIEHWLTGAEVPLQKKF